MSIVDLTKITLFGSAPERREVLDELQTLGCVHIITDKREVPSVEFTPPSAAESDREALQYLTLAGRRRRQIVDESEFNLEQVVAAALQNKQQLRAATDKKILLTDQIEEIGPWGNFVLPSPDELGGYRLWFYRIPFRERKKLEGLSETWAVVSEDHRHVYVVVIAKEEPPENLFAVSRTQVTGAPLNELKRSLYQTELEIEELEAAHSSLSRSISLLSKHLLRIEDQAALGKALEQTQEVENFFFVQGWIPNVRVPAAETLAKARGLALLEEKPTPEDRPPTLLSNPPPLAGGEDLVAFYTTPGYHAWDPSIVTAFSFAFFFAMIIADAGYALILAIPLLWFYKRIGQSAGGRRFRSIALMIVIAGFIYGVLTGSYFGYEPSTDTWLGSLRLLPSHDVNWMMLFSLGVGCLHLILANAAAAFYGRTLSGRLKPVGWIAIIIAGILFFISRGDAAKSALWDTGIALLVAGALLLVFFSSDRPVTSLKAGLLRILEGVSSLTNITKLFGDTLSYLRLFALGLASASLAYTFNSLAGKIHGSLPGFGVLFALLVLLFGHTLNLALGIISGLVHGLRLNVIEFFNWSLSEEGSPFTAFSKKETKT
jgi:V/A-type H+-transporting ATPase subunit I